MKYIYIIIGLVWFAIFYASCIDDKGNYNYENRTGLDGVEISGLKDTIAFRNEVLELTPEVRRLEDESRYSYFWYAYRDPIGGGLPQRDTIATTKNLSTEIKLAGGDYHLYFQIKDLERDVYVYEKIKLTVLETPITDGWYVLKDMDNQTDFDYISLDGEEYRDVLRNISGPNGNNQLVGEAVKIHYQAQRYYHQVKLDDGTEQLLTNQMALHVLSTEDMKTFNAKNLDLFKNYEDEFYGLPENRTPQALIGGPTYSGDLYLINGGKLHSIYGMSQNFGKFSGAKVAKTSQYELFPSILGGSDDCWVFDNLSHSFWKCASSAVNFTYLPDEEERISPVNMNVRMVDLMQIQDYVYTPTGYAVMQSLTDSEEYYLAFCTPGNSYIFSSFDTIPVGARMPEAKVKAAPSIGTYIYYAYDNKLYAHKNLKGLGLEQREVLIKELPVEESISFIKSVGNPYSESDKASVAVLVNHAGGWRLYLFELVGAGNPEINPDPVKILEGVGNARYFMLRY